MSPEESTILTIGSSQHTKHISKLEAEIDQFKYQFSTIDWVTSRIALGAYPYNKEQVLSKEGITHLLNVGDGNYQKTFKKELFSEITSIPVQDLCEIPIQTAKKALTELHRMLNSDKNTKTYVHCSAGQNRSPNILWLYLTSIGLSPEHGIKLISTARLDAVPGHEKMVPKNSTLIKEVQQFGHDNLQTIDTSILKLHYE